MAAVPTTMANQWKAAASKAELPGRAALARRLSVLISVNTVAHLQRLPPAIRYFLMLEII